MKTIGLDIGSRSIKLVFLDGDKIKEYLCVETSYDPKKQIKNLLSRFKFDYLIATGYGRYLAKEHFGAEIITEIQAHALGVKNLFHKARTILDIGGQDTKAILLDSAGKVLRFEMNDRCAAGTGRFLEVMAKALGVDLKGLSNLALSAKTAAKISSLCTVFAESEVIGLIGRGEAREVIAKGVIHSIAKRSLTLLKKVGAQRPIVFTGGVAYNKALVTALEEFLKAPILIPENPQLTGALGAALYGYQKLKQKDNF